MVKSKDSQLPLFGFDSDNVKPIQLETVILENQNQILVNTSFM